MACNICNYDFTARRRGCCASCARVTLYQPRARLASALIRCESSQAHVEAVLRPGNDGVLASLPQDADWDAITQSLKTDSIRRQHQDQQFTSQRLASILEQSEQLRRRMIQYRDQIEAQKRENAQRRVELATRRKELQKRRTTDTEPIDSAVRKIAHRLQRIHTRSADARAGLCYTASWLAGVKQETDSRRRATGRIILSNLVIPDLRELSNPLVAASVTDSQTDIKDMQHHHINACLDNICRLVSTWTHYLTISLPAEIISQHKEFPHSAVMTEKSSYRRQRVFYPERNSQPNSPTASKILLDNQGLSRPRILHLDRPLARLAKEDPKSFGLFVEGVTLLAWDLAWLCKTQGITAINTFDELCDIGRNLWLLHRAAEARVLDAQQTQVNQKRRESEQSFGILTHGTVSHSLSGYEGAALLQTWRLAQPQRLVDKLRAYLLAEMSGAEWDVLSDKDFDDEREDEIAVLVGGRRTKAEKMAAMNVMSLAGDPAKPEKGWMKVRGRGPDG